MGIVLLIGPNFHEYNQSVSQAFEFFGHRCVIYDTIIGSNYLGYRLRERLKISQTNHMKKMKFFNSKNSLRLFRELKPDFVLIIKANLITSEALSEMAKSSRLALWIMDSFNSYPEVLDLVEYFERVYVFESSDLKLLKDKKVKSSFLPLGYDDKIYFPYNEKKTVDISFVGNLNINRREILQMLVNDFPERRFEIYGGYISKYMPLKYIKYLLSDERKSFTNRLLDPVEVNRLYNRSEICLNIHHHQSKEGWNPRTCEILGAGGFQLVDNNEVLENEFGDGLVTYSGYDNLKEKIAYYLNNADEREKISQVGLGLVKNKHTFNERVRLILNDFDMS